MMAMNCLTDSAAFGVGYHPEIYKLLKEYFECLGVEANDARMRMGHVPGGVRPIDGETSLAPCFQIDNVFVLAGVPPIAHAMFKGVGNRPRLRRHRALALDPGPLRRGRPTP